MPDGFDRLLTQAAAAIPVCLGPAEVTAVLAAELEVAQDGVRRFARLAIPPLYQPVIGDTVLVIAVAEEAYVIGVLEASGPMMLRAPGDLRLSAPHGTIALDAARLELAAGEAELEAGTLSVMCQRLRESCASP